MLKRYSVQKDPPRPIDNIPLRGGLGLILNMGYIGMFLGVAAASTALIPGNPSEIVVSMLVFGLIVIATGFAIYRNGRKKLNARADALRNGFIVEGTVVDKGRKFNPFSSWKYYTVTIEFEDGRHQLVSTQPSLHEYYDMGEPMMGFRNPVSGNVFFPPEAGIRVEVRDDAGFEERKL